MTRQPDYAFEALAEVTDADPAANRGELNIALKQIKAQSEITDSYILSVEIHDQAKRYRDVMPEMLLTPTALAKHWTRVKAETERQPRGTNLAPHKADGCQTCGGDRFVVVGTRPATQTRRMIEQGIAPHEESSFEEYAPCPACGCGEVSFWRLDGSRFVTPDPGLTRERMSR